MIAWRVVFVFRLFLITTLPRRADFVERKDGGPQRSFIRVVSGNWSSRCGPLQYLPAFNAVITASNEDIRLQLVNYQGRKLPDFSGTYPLSLYSPKKNTSSLGWSCTLYKSSFSFPTVPITLQMSLCPTPVGQSRF